MDAVHSAASKREISLLTLDVWTFNEEARLFFFGAKASRRIMRGYGTVNHLVVATRMELGPNGGTRAVVGP
jgi:hypothetical protein